MAYRLYESVGGGRYDPCEPTLTDQLLNAILAAHKEMMERLLTQSLFTSDDRKYLLAIKEDIDTGPTSSAEIANQEEENLRSELRGED